MGAHWLGQNYIACKGDGTTNTKGGIALNPKDITCRRCRKWVTNLMGVKRFNPNWTSEEIHNTELNNNNNETENTDMPTTPTTPEATTYNCANCNKEQKLTVVSDLEVFCDKKCMLEYVTKQQGITPVVEKLDVDKEIDALMKKAFEINNPAPEKAATNEEKTMAKAPDENVINLPGDSATTTNEEKTMPKTTNEEKTMPKTTNEEKTMPDPTPVTLPLFNFNPETKKTTFLYETAPEEIANWEETIVFSYMGKDDKKPLRREEASPTDLFRLFQAVLNNNNEENNPIHRYVPLTGDVARLFVYAIDRKTKKATHTLIELQRKGKGDKARIVDTCHTNPKGKDMGNHPNMVAIGAAYKAFSEATNNEENNMEKKNIVIRMAYSVKQMVVKLAKKVMGWARSFIGWNIEQRHAILGAVATCYGGMWFWFIMGGALPIYVFGVTNALWFATAVGFLSMYAVLAYLTYALAYGVVAGLVALKNTVGEFMALKDASVSPEMTAAVANA